MYDQYPPVQERSRVELWLCCIGFGLALIDAESIGAIDVVVDDVVVIVVEVDVVDRDVEVEVDVDVEDEVVVVVVGGLTVMIATFVYTCCELESATYAQ